METIVSFHTGRGGRFYNSGHTTFIGEKKISDFTEDLFLHYENELDIYNKVKNLPNLLDLYYKATDNYDTELNESALKFEKRTGLEFGELIWTKCNGNPVGLTYEQSQEGVGCIDIDGDYNRTCSMYLKDCGENECELIHESLEWNYEQLLRERFDDAIKELGLCWDDFYGDWYELIADYFSGGEIKWLFESKE